MDQGIRKPIYLDAHATTPVDPRVMEVMLPYFSEHYGNAASKTHIFGNDAHSAVESAREKLAKSIKAKPQEIIFTSGATESINIAIKGVALANRDSNCHFVTVATEHRAVLDCHLWLEKEGFKVTYLRVDPHGLIDLEDLQKAIRDNTVLVSVMVANNEIGVIQPIEEIGKICSEKGVIFFSDATQALGKLYLDVKKMGIHLLAASAHKVYGPNGIGLLYARRSNPRVKLEPIIHGGGHERGLRSGTSNVPAIVGFSKAVEIAYGNMKVEQTRIRQLRDQLQNELLKAFPGAKVNGHIEQRLAGNLNITFPGIEAEALMIALKDEIAVSSGSACTTAKIEPSHVLTALNLEEDAIHSSIRFGISRMNTIEEIMLVTKCLNTVTSVLM